ncbi:MAG: tetratricopeptide repeat protein [Alphaproteobacteria bacterium]|nr:tetratricopeptide repeat protein [Alphaproteobacteria bacterium]
MPKRPAVSSPHEITRSAQALLDAGRPDDAVAEFERVLELVPDDPKVVCCVASIAQQLGRPERVEHCVRAGLARNPDIAEYHHYLGNALMDMERHDEAGAALRRALELKPDFAEACGSLGAVLMQQQRTDAAIAYLQRSIALDPKLAAAHMNLGAALFLQGRMTEAIASLRTAIALDPRSGAAYMSLAASMNYLPGATAGLIAEATRRWASLLSRPGRRLPFANDRDPDRVLRIGYVSGDFRSHAVALFLEAVLAAHDHRAVEITCYSNNPADDHVTERLKRLADRWRVIKGVKDEDADALIRRDGIDILIDLSGHTLHSRLELFVHKPAPVQCTWLGYYATTGLPEIDYIIADRVVVPPGDEGLYAETPWRLPDSYLCFTMPEGAPEPSSLPALANGFVTFGSCNKARKTNNAVIALWSKLLHEVPRSRLVLRAPEFSHERVCRAMSERFAECGIAAERVTLLGNGSRQDILATYQRFDIALDPHPYAGGTTTMEALWMGVPVISMHGNRFSGRVSETILATSGLGELMAGDEASYLRRAIALAQDLPRLADLRNRLRSIVASSPICDAKRFTRHLEAAYREMWRGWCARSEASA